MPCSSIQKIFIKVFLVSHMHLNKQEIILIDRYPFMYADGSANHTQKESHEMKNKDMSSIYPEQRAQPCQFTSSIYYGGQDVYAHPQNSHNSVAKSTVSVFNTIVCSFISNSM